MTVSPSSPAGHSTSFSPRRLLKGMIEVLVRRRWLILGFMVFGVVAGGVLFWVNVDQYRSRAVLLIDWPAPTGNLEGAVLNGQGDRERVVRVTQHVLSRPNLQRIIDEFHLYPKLLQSQGYEAAIEEFRTQIQIEMKDGGRKMEALSIAFTHSDPAIARQITDKLSAGYLEITDQSHSPHSDPSSEVLYQELSEVQEALDQQEQELSAFKVNHADELLEKLPENMKIRDRLQDDMSGIQKRIDRLQFQVEQAGQLINEKEDRLAQRSSSPHRLNGEDRQRLASRLLFLKNALLDKSGEFGEDHPDMIELTTEINKTAQELERHLVNEEEDVAILSAQIGELNSQRQDMNQQIQDSQAQLKKLTRSFRFFESRIEQTPQRQQELSALQDEYAKLQANYERLHNRWIDARISENLDARQLDPKFRVLDAASLPIEPEGTFRAWLPLEGYMVGTGLGLAVAFILDWFSPTFRRPEDVEVSLGLQTLATIPGFHLAYGKSFHALPSAIKGHPASGELALLGQQSRDYVDTTDLSKNGAIYGGKSPERFGVPPQLDLVSRWRPQSIVAEQYRVAATRLDLLGEGDQCTIVLVTSSKKGEGKTCTSSNLAYTLARDLDEPTLVMDCDYKCPNLHNLFGVDPTPGVAEFLAGQESLEACQKHIADVPLWCMPVGDLAQYPVSLGKLQKLSLILAAVKARYRYIILDGPPILPLADTNILSGLASIVLMVVRFGATPKDVVQKAVEMIHFRGPTRLILTDTGSHGVPSYVTLGRDSPLLVGRQS